MSKSTSYAGNSILTGARRAGSFLLSAVLAMSIASPALADTVTTAGANSSVPVQVSSTAPNFSVVLPTALPIAVAADGTVTCAQSGVAKIVNNSSGPIDITNVSMVAANGWALVAFNTDYSAVPVGTKQFGFKLQGENVPTTGECAASAFETIDGGDELGITYDATVAVQSTAVENTIANITFVVGWHEENVPVVSLVNWTTEQAAAIYTWTESNGEIRITGLSNAGKGLASITEMPDTIDDKPVTSIGDKAFYDDMSFEGCANLALTSLPAGITSIGYAAFDDCTNLALTSLPNSLTSIGMAAFAHCINISMTSLPAGVTSIGNSSFAYCTNLALTSLSVGLTTIGNEAFNECTSLALTSLPDGVTSIGQYAFNNCTNVNITTVPCSYGFGAFNGTQCTTPTIA